jgi:uncharacterized protein (DUF2141 family)
LPEKPELWILNVLLNGMKPILFFLCILPALGLSQNTLHVSVDGVKNSDGNISIALYNQEDGFLHFDKVFKSDSTIAKKGNTQISIKDLPEGDYALAIFHDENANNILDVNWLGIPKEMVGFSNATMKTFGPPSFKECAFRITSDQDILVKL